MRGGRVGSLAASPTLVGAVTVLVIVVAVFLSYQANKGLPFVPTYQISAEVPNANTLVPGNDVRIGGIRVGQITDIQPVSHEDGAGRRQGRHGAEPGSRARCPRTPTSSSGPARPSASSTWSCGGAPPTRASPAGSTMPLSAARPEPVEIDQVFNMFDEPTRDAIQANLLEFGNALAGRGVSLNNAIGELRPSSSGSSR